jgi:hypothetical protein
VHKSCTTRSSRESGHLETHAESRRH